MAFIVSRNLPVDPSTCSLASNDLPHCPPLSSSSFTGKSRLFITSQQGMPLPSCDNGSLVSQSLRLKSRSGAKKYAYFNSPKSLVRMASSTLGTPQSQELELPYQEISTVVKRDLTHDSEQMQKNSSCTEDTFVASATHTGQLQGNEETQNYSDEQNLGDDYNDEQNIRDEENLEDTMSIADDITLPVRWLHGNYDKELEVAVRAVQLACMLSQRTQERLLRNEEKAGSKMDRSLVTVADWGVQAVVSWVLSQSFGGEEISMVAEEDTNALKGMDGIHLLQRVVSSVNECLGFAPSVGLNPPKHPLGTIDVLKAINKGSSDGGPRGRHWVLDPVDGTLGFVRGDQYAIALAMIEDGEVVLGVLGCPNFPMKREWLNYHHRYYRLMSKFSPPSPALWHKGCILMAQRGGGGAWMQPLVWNANDLGILKLARPVSVSSIEDPAEAAFCEPVEKANSSHSFTAGLASSIGLRKQPLRVYSMAKYAAIARGDAEIFMKFARAGYKEKIWDHAAGVLIVQEAGGVVTDAGGQPLDFSQGRFLEGVDRGIIACSGKKLHEKLVEAVDASWDSSRL